MTVWVPSNRIFLVAAAVFAALTMIVGARLQGANAMLGGQSFVLQIADTPAKRTQGLSGQAGLKEHEGMLFIYDQAETSCFWMKDMRFDLDMLWFDAAGMLVYQKLGAAPASYPQSFCTPTAAKYVLEINAGSAQKYGFGPGTTLKFAKKR